MSGIIHKESLPGQSLIKRRRVDTQATTEPCREGKFGDGNEKRVENVAKSGPGENNAISCTEAQPRSFGSVSGSFAKTQNPSSSSSSNSSSDDDDDDQIERENARLAKLRAQRSRRRQEQHKTGGSSSSSAQPSANAPGGVDTTPPPSVLKAQEVALHTNSYDHDVLFRNAAWRNPSKTTTAEEKRKQKWDSVLNRTQDSVAFGHFMKNYFK